MRSITSPSTTTTTTTTNKPHINSGDVRPQSRGDRYPITVIAFGDGTFAAVNLHQECYAEFNPRRSSYTEADLDGDSIYRGVLARTVQRLGGTFRTWDQLQARVAGARLAA